MFRTYSKGINEDNDAESEEDPSRSSRYVIVIIGILFFIVKLWPPPHKHPNPQTPWSTLLSGSSKWREFQMATYA